MHRNVAVFTETPYLLRVIIRYHVLVFQRVLSWLFWHRVFLLILSRLHFPVFAITPSFLSILARLLVSYLQIPTMRTRSIEYVKEYVVHER